MSLPNNQHEWNTKYSKNWQKKKFNTLFFFFTNIYQIFRKEVTPSGEGKKMLSSWNFFRCIN